MIAFERIEIDLARVDAEVDTVLEAVRHQGRWWIPAKGGPRGRRDLGSGKDWRRHGGDPSEPYVGVPASFVEVLEMSVKQRRFDLVAGVEGLAFRSIAGRGARTSRLR
jgi:hypothetical protein